MNVYSSVLSLVSKFYSAKWQWTKCEKTHGSDNHYVDNMNKKYQWPPMRSETSTEKTE